jgi:hypothetical protein
MEKLTAHHHKADMSLCGLVAQAAARGGRASSCVQGKAVAGRPARLRVRAAGLAFAAVRPAFFAACIVDPVVAEAGGGPAATTAAVTSAVTSAAPSAVGWGGRARGRCHAGAVGESARPRRRRGGGGSRLASRECQRRRQLNGQIEHFSQVAARLRGGAVRGAAITPRERADSLDLRLTTLSSEPCVQSSIFGFVMT